MSMLERQRSHYVEDSVLAITALRFIPSRQIVLQAMSRVFLQSEHVLRKESGYVLGLANCLTAAAAG